jgi:hypothetical protein
MNHPDKDFLKAYWLLFVKPRYKWTDQEEHFLERYFT